MSKNMSDPKDTNPKDAVGTRKVPFGTVPAPFIGELALAMLEGARKYGRHNYRVIGVRASVYYEAALRHIMAWWEGEDIDPDSGLSHVIKAAACLAILRDSMRQQNWTDDRPPRVPSGWVQELNAKAAEIIDRIHKSADAYTASATSCSSSPNDQHCPCVCVDRCCYCKSEQGT
jgi:hypothetical protein